MDAQANEVIVKVQALVKTKFHGDYLAAFAHYDLDHNQKLGHKDVVVLLEDCGIGNFLTRGVWASGVIAALDQNGDGTVTLAEMAFALAKGVAFPPAG